MRKRGVRRFHKYMYDKSIDRHSVEQARLRGGRPAEQLVTYLLPLIVASLKLHAPRERKYTLRKGA